MASLGISSLYKPASLRFSGLVKSSSSNATGAEASSISMLQIRKFATNGSKTYNQRPFNDRIHQSFYERCTMLHRKKDKKFELDATSNSNPKFDATPVLMDPMQRFISFVDVLYRFIRPYAALGTVLNVASMSLLAVKNLSDMSPLFFIKVLQALVGGLLMEMYVCGFNQICDIELDKVNKPYLPLAAGQLSMGTATMICSLSAIMSLSIAWIVGSKPLFWGFTAWFAVGTAYSANVLPLLRWKRFPLTAALFMLIARALGVPIAYYMHIQNSIYGGSLVLSRPILFAVGILSAFCISIIFFKDIPDIEGDLMHGMKSLASRIGETQMFWSCIWVLEIAYVAAAFVGATSSITWSKYATIIGHLVMALILWLRAKSVDIKSNEAVQSMYMFLWLLFYVEYILILLVR